MERFVSKNKGVGSCPICYRKNPIELDHKNDFTIWKCSGCNLLWIPNIDEKILNDFYSSRSYFRSENPMFGYNNYIKGEEALRLNARYLLSEFPKFNDYPKILDIGCAHGFLLDEARGLGWETQGLEFSAEAANYAVNKLNLNVSIGSVMQAEFSENSFDAVTIVGTIEHLADPIAAVRKINKILKIGGYFAITTINTEGLIRLFELKPPEHLFYFSAKNLSLLLAREGFTVLKQHSYWRYYTLNEALNRTIRLISKLFLPISLNKRIEKLLGRISFSKMPMKVPTNEMFILSQKFI